MKRVVGALCLLTTLAALALSAACSCAPPSAPPAPAGCDTPAPVGAVTAIEIGSGRPFTPFVPGDLLDEQSGGQGLSMEGFRIGVRSSTPITCIAQHTQAGSVAFDGNLAVGAGGGWYLTDELLVVGGGPLHVVTTAYGMTVTRDMSLYPSTDAALPDAP